MPLGFCPVISSPFSRIVPVSGGVSPQILFRSVVFPAPFGSDDPDDLTLRGRQADIAQRGDAAERDGDAVDGE